MKKAARYLYSRIPEQCSGEASLRQERNLLLYAEAAGLELVAAYGDKSGGPRSGLKALVGAAASRAFDVVIVEKLPRLPFTDLLAFHAGLRAHGVALHVVGTGPVDLLNVLAGGVMEAEAHRARLQLQALTLVRSEEALRHPGDDGCVNSEGHTSGATLPGLSVLLRGSFLERCEAGRRAAASVGKLFHSPIYGYRRHPRLKGVHCVDAERAAVVRDVFAMVAEGLKPSRVALALSQRTPSPACCRLADGGVEDAAAKPWTAAEVRAIVRHSLPAGFVVYRRLRHSRDGRPRGDLRADEDVVVVEVAAYRIVYPDLAARAQAALVRRAAGGSLK